MTRTELICLSKQIKNKPLETTVGPLYVGTVYTGLFMKRPIFCFFDIDDNPIAVAYKKVLYCFKKVDTTDLIVALKDFYMEHHCNTKVMLYSNTSCILFIDEEGTFRSYTPISQQCDYIDCIPLPRA